MKRIFLGLCAIIVLGLVSLFSFGYARTSAYGWYPFITSVFADFYTAGPFAMTSNVREDNPVWSDLPTINQTLARLTYAMTRGEPQSDIAWLFPTQEWIDKPAIGEGVAPNRHESDISREITQAGLVYDRISRRDLEQAQASERQIVVGAMHYKALLIDDLPVASPELLQSVQKLTAQGVPVIWLGALPERASGWTNHTQRDVEVRRLRDELRSQISVVSQADAIVPALVARGVASSLLATGARIAGLRTQRRALGNGTLILLFNDSSTPIDFFPSFVPMISDRHSIELLNPEDGRSISVTPKQLRMTIPARRTRIVKLGDTTRFWNPAQWQNPSLEFRPYIRWWWPGNAVEAHELRRELRSLHAAGFGGVELQTLTLGITYPDLERYAKEIYGVGTPEYFANLKIVFEMAQELGLRVDLTLGSGWPSGGPFIDRHPEQQLLASSFDVGGPATIAQHLPPPQEPRYVTPTNWIIRNTLGSFDRDAQLEAVVAAKIDGTTTPPTLTEFIDLRAYVQGENLQWEAPAGHWRIFALYRNRTQHNSVAAAFPGALTQSRVIDHLDPGGVQEYIDELGSPWLEALAPYKPQAFFVDSFELIGELPWSAQFRQTFLAQHDYDLTPYLPLVFKAYGESKYLNMIVAPRAAYQTPSETGIRIREDYEATREKLFREAFVAPLKEWATSKGVQLRLQAHGGYGDYLDCYQVADIPEAEGLFAAGSFEFLKLAASAGHVAGRKIISSESFIVMALDFQALDADDYYDLAGNAYAAGINRLMYHGHAYRWTMQNGSDADVTQSTSTSR